MHSDYVDVVNVLMSEGYLSLRSKESVELFNELVENGLLFEVLSNLFNDYAKGKNSIDNLANQVQTLVQVNRAMIKKMENGSIIKPKEEVVEVIEQKPKEISVQATKKALKGKNNLMAQLKSGFNKIK